MRRKLNDALASQMLRLYAAGLTASEIAKLIGQPPGSVSSWLWKLGANRGDGGKRGSLAARFHAFVVPEPNSGCWLWDGHLMPTGYGQMGVAPGRTKLATHVSLHLCGRDVPPGMFVCHRCDVPACVNPDHLFIGTPADNVRDMISKGRQRAPSGEQHRAAKLTENDVREIRALAGAAQSQSQIARRYGVAKATIGHVLTGRTWKSPHDRRAARLRRQGSQAAGGDPATAGGAVKP